MFKLIKNRQGIALILSYIVIVVLMILVSVFFLSSIAEKNHIQREKDRAKAFYLAKKGMDYAQYEIKSGPWPEEKDTHSGWRTHFILATQGGSYYYDAPLQQIYTRASQAGPNFISISEKCKIQDDNPGSPDYGCYVPINPAREGNFIVKTYADPFDSCCTIVLSKGTSGSESVMLASNLKSQSLYNYFMFSPKGMFMEKTTYEANFGSIHANDGITFGEQALIKDIKTLSTGGGFSYALTKEVPPDNWGDYQRLQQYGATNGQGDEYDWDAVFPWMRYPWTNYYQGHPVITPTPQGEGELYGDKYIYFNSPDGHLAGQPNGVQGNSVMGMYVTPNPAPLLSSITPDTGAMGATPIPIPNTLEGRYQTFQYFWYEELPVALQPFAHGPGIQNPQIDTNALLSTTTAQAGNWMTDYLVPNDLQNIFQDANNGGYEISPMTIEANNYLTQAQDYGIYIKKTGSGANALQVTVNGGDALTQAEWSRFITPVTFTNSNSGNSNYVVKINVGALLNDPRYAPSNGIIFSTLNTLLYNAQQLPNEGLTTVSQGNAYIQGDYNTGTFQPSAVITAKYFYTLSDNFPDDGPNYLTKTTHHTNWPYADPPYAVNSDFTPGAKGSGANWYLDNDPLMSNTVDRDYTYNVAVVGPHAMSWPSLERWQYYSNLGDKTSQPPSGWTSKYRDITGAFILLPPENFKANWDYETGLPVRSGQFNYTGLMDDSGAAGRVGENPPRTAPMWPGDMTSTKPDQERLTYEAGYFQGGAVNPPPGGLPGYSVSLLLPITNSFYFDHHNPATSFTPPYVEPTCPVCNPAAL